MKILRILAWVFTVLAGALAAYSLCVTFSIFNDAFQPTLGHTPGGAPGNAASGIGIGIALGVAVISALVAFITALIVAPTNKKETLYKAARFIQVLAVIGFCAPFTLALLEYFTE